MYSWSRVEGEGGEIQGAGAYGLTQYQLCTGIGQFVPTQKVLASPCFSSPSLTLCLREAADAGGRERWQLDLLGPAEAVRLRALQGQTRLGDDLIRGWQQGQAGAATAAASLGPHLQLLLSRLGGSNNLPQFLCRKGQPVAQLVGHAPARLGVKAEGQVLQGGRAAAHEASEGDAGLHQAAQEGGGLTW